jgi:hypothetical protein
MLSDVNGNQNAAFASSGTNESNEESLALKSLLGRDSTGESDGSRIKNFFASTYQQKCAELRWKNRHILLKGSKNNAMPSGWDDDNVKESPYEELVNQGWNALIQLLDAAGGEPPEPHMAPLLFKDQTSVTNNLDSTYNNSVFAAYLDGCSVVLNHADWSSPWIAALCFDIQKSLPHAYGNVYITPPGSQAVHAHADDRDVIVIQVAGAKKWKIYQKIPIPFPYTHEQVGKDGLEVPDEVLQGPTLFETTLYPGDAIYMPRGYVHEARATDNLCSFHVTIALATHDWTLAGIFTNATDKILHCVLEYRKAINRKFGVRDLSQISAEEKEELQQQINGAFQLLQEEVNVQTMSDNLGTKFSRHNRRAFSQRMKIIHNMRFPPVPEEDSVPIVGPQAAKSVTMTTVLRASTADEKESVMMDHPRGLSVREQIAEAIIQIVQALKSQPTLHCAVKDLKSLIGTSAMNSDLICDLTLLSFAKVCVEQGGLAVVRQENG